MLNKDILLQNLLELDIGKLVKHVKYPHLTTHMSNRF